MRSKEKRSEIAGQQQDSDSWQVGSRKLDLDAGALVMGILNVTPDSFSDGGRWEAAASALAQAERMIREGADIIDIGGESSRPGSDPVGLEDEISRVIPVIEQLASRWSGVISVDTSKAEVARLALQAGATLINDISGLRDPEMVEVCAASTCGVVVMHMKGVPKSMQEAPIYQDVVSEVRAFFEERLATLEASGIAADRLCWDPGIGFGKRLEDNLALIKSVAALKAGSRPVMMGLSRKSFLAQLLGESDLEARNASTVALTAWTRAQGAVVHRVHQVAENRDALRMVEAIAGS